MIVTMVTIVLHGVSNVYCDHGHNYTNYNLCVVTHIVLKDINQYQYL
jgi:hypothetical protein